MKTSFCCILAILFVALHAQSAIYVKPGATGGGTSWADAADLEAALAQAQLSGGDVYVAKGFYQPSATLMIANGVSVYGGFAGVDSGETPHGFSCVDYDGWGYVYYPLDRNDLLFGSNFGNPGKMLLGRGVYKAPLKLKGISIEHARRPLGLKGFGEAYEKPKLRLAAVFAR